MCVDSRQKQYLIIIFVFFLAMSFLNIIPDYHLLSPDHAAPFLLSGEASGPPLITHEPRPNYFAFLKPVRLLIIKQKLLHWYESKTLILLLTATRNTDIALIVLPLFFIFYQLARISFEKPGLHWF